MGSHARLLTRLATEREDRDAVLQRARALLARAPSGGEEDAAGRGEDEDEDSGEETMVLAASAVLLETAGLASAREAASIVSAVGPEAEGLVEEKLLPALAQTEWRDGSHLANLHGDALQLRDVVDVQWSLSYPVRGSSLTGSWQTPIFFVNITVRAQDDKEEVIKIMFTRAQLETFVAKTADARAQALAVAERA